MALIKLATDREVLKITPSLFCDCVRGQAARKARELRAAGWETFEQQTREKSEQLKKKARSQLFVDAGIPTRFQGMTINSFRARYNVKTKAEAINAAETLIREIKLPKQAAGQFYYGLWLWGDYGVGKTSLLSTVYAALLEKLGGGLWINYYSFLDQIRGGFEDNTASARKQQAMLAPVLMIEDMGNVAKGAETAFNREVFWQIIYHRHANNMPTLITSNLGKYEMSAHFGEGLYQRLAELLKIIEVGGPLLRNLG